MHGLPVHKLPVRNQNFPTSQIFGDKRIIYRGRFRKLFQTTKQRRPTCLHQAKYLGEEPPFWKTHWDESSDRSEFGHKVKSTHPIPFQTGDCISNQGFYVVVQIMLILCKQEISWWHITSSRVKLKFSSRRSDHRIQRQAIPKSSFEVNEVFLINSAKTTFL